MASVETKEVPNDEQPKVSTEENGAKKVESTSEKPSGSSNDVDSLDLSLANITTEGTIDKPELSLKSDKLNEEVEAPEIEVKKVRK